MNMRRSWMYIVLMAVPFVAATAQTKVRHIQQDDRPIATAVWAGDTLYISGQTATAPTAEADKPAPTANGDTDAQTMSALTNLETVLKAQGLAMSDVVNMRVNLVGDPAKGGKLDYPEMMAAYTRFFGTKDQPFKPARVTVQVAALVAPWALVEIEAIATKPEGQPTR